VFFIGPLLAQERWLVEGYATGLSVRAALRELHRDAQVVVCFSAGNLAHVGKLVKELRPKAYVFADNDKSGAGEGGGGRNRPQLGDAGEVGDANDYAPAPRRKRAGKADSRNAVRKTGSSRIGERHFALVGQPAAARGDGRERTVGKVLKNRACGWRRKRPRTERLPGVSGSEGSWLKAHLVDSGLARCAHQRAGGEERRVDEGEEKRKQTNAETAPTAKR
jgi:hypothetical protein